MKLDKAFPETPTAFKDAIRSGIRKGEKRMKLRYKIRLASVAAILAACLVLVAYAASTGDRTDTTAAGQPSSGQSTASGGQSTASGTVPVSPTPTPIYAGYPADTASKEKMVYCTEHGSYYHNDPFCQGMQNAIPVPIDEAREEGKLPCPVCIGETVYATANGRWYHSDPNCQGMQNAGEWSVSDAEANGKLPCPVCLSGRSIDYASYRKKALDAMNAVFPGCVEVFTNHYYVDQLYVQLRTDASCVYADVEANSVTVAQIIFDGDAALVSLLFNDVEICGKVLACRQEGTLSEKLSDLYASCKGKLMSSLLAAIHDTCRSNMPVSVDNYYLRELELEFFDSECQTAKFIFATQYYCEASFTFDLVEGDSLRNVMLEAQ